LVDRSVWIIFRREFTDIMRDSKTLIGAFLIPILVIPFVIYVMNLSLTQAEREARSYIPLAIQGDVREPVVLELAKVPGVKIVPMPDPIQGVKEGKLRAALAIPNGFGQRLEKGEAAALTVWYDPSNQKSEVSKEVIREAIAAYETKVVTRRLEAAGLSPQTVHPIGLSFASVATEERMAGSMLAAIVPLMLMLSLASGGIPVAVDSIVGEKERGTLESLITAPVTAGSILTAKLLAVMMMSTISSLASAISLTLVFSMAPDRQSPLALGFFHPLSVGILVMTLLLQSALFAGVELLVSTLARSPRQAQIFLMPVAFLASLPAYIMMPLTPMDIPFHDYLLPIFNGTAMLKEIFYGDVQIGHALAVLFSSMLYVAVVIGIAGKLFRREKLLVK
jgi:sodium transport system permease protein